MGKEIAKENIKAQIRRITERAQREDREVWDRQPEEPMEGANGTE